MAIMPAVFAGEGAETDEERRQRLARAMPAVAQPISAPSASPSTMPPVPASAPRSNAFATPLEGRAKELATGATVQPRMPAVPPTAAPPAPELGPPPLPAVPGGPRVIPGAPARPASIAGSETPPMPPVPVQPAQAAQPPELHGWKKVLDVIGSMFPIGRAIETAIPGTPQNFNMKQAMEAARTETGQKLERGRQEIAANEPDLHRRNIESEISARGDKDAQALAKIGMKRDENGGIVPDENSEIYKGQQAKILTAEETAKNLNALRQAQTELAQARTEVENAKNDPDSPAYKQAQQKLAMAQRAHEVAAANLGLHQQEFANKLKEQELVKPSGQTQSRGSAARSALDVIPHLEKLTLEQAKNMGPIVGRIARGEIAIGNVEPAVAELYGAMKSFYALQPAVHGFRNAEFVKDFETAIGTLERNPEAFLAGVKGLRPTLEAVEKEGKTFHKRIVEGAGGGKGALSVAEAQDYLKKAGGDKAKAREMAKQDGRTF
jgi:hypothetical protein